MIPNGSSRTGSSTVDEVIDQRVAIYGDPTQTFGRIAEVWSGIIGHHVNAVDVPLMLMGMKLVRTQVTPDYSDNSDDIEGYLDIFRQLVGEDMVHARLTSEYLEKKNGTAYERRLYTQDVCEHCREGEAFHDPITRACQRPSAQGETFEAQA
jgi:hypothetical protein